MQQSMHSLRASYMAPVAKCAGKATKIIRETMQHRMLTACCSLADATGREQADHARIALPLT